METIYDNISVEELKEIMKEKKNWRKFKLVKVPSYDGWRYALYTKNGHRVDVQKNGGQLQATY